MKLVFRILPVIVALVARPAQAQVATLRLMGKVQTDDRTALPGAAVTVIHLPSGARYVAASNATGSFAIANLQAGGPYLMRIGEGGYRTQTLESIFLEPGKTATFTVTLSKLATGSGKERPARANEAPVATESLAAEAVVGGPVLISTSTGGSGLAGPAPAPAPAGSAPAPRPASRYRRNPNYQPGATRGAAPLVSGHFDAQSGNYLYDTGQPTTLKLPSGQTIPAVGINSTESNLYRFLTNPQAVVDTVDLTRGWYNFDRVFFHPGKATLTAESLNQLRNVATLLRAYPKARVKLGGYTDSTGTRKVNQQLSDARARTAWASLVEMGISPSRVEARGYGPRYAIAPNTTEEGRSMNRRLSVKVLTK